MHILSEFDPPVAAAAEPEPVEPEPLAIVPPAVESESADPRDAEISKLKERLNKVQGSQRPL